MIVVLYLAHGISIRTTSALFGTLVGIALTGLLGLGATAWTSLSGVGSENDQMLVATVPGIHLSGVVAATMVIAGLGVLNDVTVTQASAVWELRALQPAMRAGTLFASAMRIGRDHIASSVYTLVFAYAGSAMTILLLITAYQQSLGDDGHDRGDRHRDRPYDRRRDRARARRADHDGVRGADGAEGRGRRTPTPTHHRRTRRGSHAGTAGA